MKRRRVLYVSAAILTVVALTVGGVAWYRAHQPTNSDDWTRKSRDPLSAKSHLLYVSILTGLPTSNTASVGGVYSIDPDEEVWNQVLDHTVKYLSVVGDSGRVAYNHERAVWVKDKTGTGKKIADQDGRPIWSPDGKSLLIVASRGPVNGQWKSDTYKVTADGAGLEKLPIPDTQFVEDWSSDGKWLLTKTLKATPKDRCSLFLVELDGSHLTRILDEDLQVTSARFAPDMQSVLANLQGRDQSLWIISKDGAQKQKILEDKTGLSLAGCWSSDGTRLAIVIQNEDTPGSARIELMDRSGANRHVLKLPKAVAIGAPDWR